MTIFDWVKNGLRGYDARDIRAYLNIKKRNGIISPNLNKKARLRLQDISCEFSNENGSIYQFKEDYLLFEIKNDELAKHLFKIRENATEIERTIDLNRLRIKFLNLKKEKKTVFIVLKYQLPSFERPKDSIVRIASRSGDWYTFFNAILSLFSTDEQKISFNYSSLFENIMSERMNIAAGILMNLSLRDYSKDEPRQIEYVIRQLIHGYGDGKSMGDMGSYLNRYHTPDEEVFSSCIKHGVYITEHDPFHFHDLPMYLYLNLLKYLSLSDAFTTVNDLLKNTLPDWCPIKLQSYGYYRFVYDEELFWKNTKSVLKTNDNETVISDSGNIIYNIPSIEITGENYFSIYNRGGFPAGSLIQWSDTGYIWAELLSQRTTTIREYIKYLGLNEKKFGLFITDIIENLVFNEEIYFANKEQAIDSICYNQQTSTFEFCNFQNIRLGKKQKGCYVADVVMEAIKEFMASKQMSVDDVYKLSFMTRFTPGFVTELINYLTSNQYKKAGIKNELYATLRGGKIDNTDSVIFVENIIYTEFALRRITFDPTVVPNEHMNNILQSKDALETLTIDYTCLNWPNTEMYLTQESFRYISESALGSHFLQPKQFIISKDYTNGKHYRIIGCIWNKYKVFSFVGLLKKNSINERQVYTVLFELLKLYAMQSITMKHMIGGLENLLVDENYHVIINTTSLVNGVYKTPYAYKNICTYYERLRELLKLCCQKHGVQISDFAFSSFVPYIEEYRHNNRLDIKYVEQFELGLSSMRFCKEHERWYISCCPICEKTYLICDKSIYYKTMWSDRLSEIQRVDESGEIVVSSPHMKYANVKLGLANSLYDKFIGLKPIKITCDSSSNMWGVQISGINFNEVMQLYSFKQNQRLKVILTLYKKVLPYILDGSFILPGFNATNVNVFKTMFMHKKFKGEIIIPNLFFIDCKTILSKDDAIRKEGIAKTKKAFSTFLMDYIKEDVYFAKALLDKNSKISGIFIDIQQGNYTYELIHSYVAQMNKYCNTHKMYFDQDLSVCPMCESAGITTRDAIIKDGTYYESLAKSKAIYDGGEANLYSYDKGMIQKIFKPDANLEFKTKILGKALSKKFKIQAFNAENDDIEFVCIDKILYLYDEAKGLTLKGYTQKHIADSYKISLLKDKEFVENMGYSRKDIVDILIKVCRGIEFLHSIGGVIGDLNGGNILIKNKKVYFIDFDGMSFDEVRNYVYTERYIYPPSAENNNITSNDDWYSLAIHAFYYLTYTHPFRGISKSILVPEDEVSRMRLGYSLLGSHGIKRPSVCIGWDFMPPELINFFLHTFEGKKRCSMRKILENMSFSMQSKELKLEAVVRNEAAAINITKDAYVTVDGRVMVKEHHIITIGAEQYEKIQVVNNTIVIEGFGSSYANITAIIDIESASHRMINKSYSDCNILCIANGNIYYSTKSDGILYVDKYNQTGEYSTYEVRKATGDRVLALSVVGKDKFVFLEEVDRAKGEYAIYCNTQYLGNISNKNATGFSIAYDPKSQTWIVLFISGSDTEAVIIDKQMNYKLLKIPERVSLSNRFYANVLYFVTSGLICYYNVNINKLSKKGCEPATVNSFIERDSSELVVTNVDQSYKYVKT